MKEPHRYPKERMIRQKPVSLRFELVCTLRSKITGPNVDKQRPRAVYIKQYKTHPRPGALEKKASQEAVVGPTPSS
jgi:hypothetical protein